MEHVFLALLLVEMVNAALLLWGPNLASPQALDERVSGAGVVAVWNQVQAVAEVAVEGGLVLVGGLVVAAIALHHVLLVRCFFRVDSCPRLYARIQNLSQTLGHVSLFLYLLVFGLLALPPISLLHHHFVKNKKNFLVAWLFC